MKILRDIVTAIGLLVGLTFIFISIQASSSKELKDKVPTQVETPIAIQEESTVVEVIEAPHWYEAPQITDSIEFCGEYVPLSDKNVYERLDRELLVNMYWHSNTILMFKRANKYFPMMRKILKEEGVPEDFLYLAMAESALTNASSSAGARGFWQFMKATGAKYGLEIRNEVDERFHLEKATRAACNYLKKTKSMFGSWTLAAAAYNRGENGLRRALNSQNVKSYYDLYLNNETSRYVFRIIALKTIHQDMEKFHFKLTDADLYRLPDTYTVSVDTTVKSLPLLAQEYGTTYKILRDLNPWVRSYSLTNKKKKRYVFNMPMMEAEGAEE